MKALFQFLENFHPLTDEDKYGIEENGKTI